MNRPRWVQHNGWDELGELIHVGTHAMEGNISQTGDDEVQRLVARGEYRSALEALVRGYQHLIVRYCTAMLGDAGHGEEVAQEVFLGAYAALPRFRQEASLRTWLLAIARKQCLKALRDRRRRRRLEEEQRQEIVSGAHRVPPDPSAGGSGGAAAAGAAGPRAAGGGGADGAPAALRDGADPRGGGAHPGAVGGRGAPAAGAGARAAAEGARGSPREP